VLSVPWTFWQGLARAARLVPPLVLVTCLGAAATQFGDPVSPTTGEQASPSTDRDWAALDPQLPGPVAGGPVIGDPGGDLTVRPATSTGLPVAAAGGIPPRAAQAYRSAATRINQQDPSCSMHWSLLAGIGRVESNHGRHGGSALRADGRVAPPIIGIRLDGTTPGSARISDSDDGRWDGDSAFDRAVGPMQFLPGTWSRYGADGDGDRRDDPQDLDDAALAAARYLCAGDVDLSTRAGRSAAVFRYNHDDGYVSLVLSYADQYARSPLTLAATPGGPGGGTGSLVALGATGRPTAPSRVTSTTRPKPVTSTVTITSVRQAEPVVETTTPPESISSTTLAAETPVESPTPTPTTCTPVPTGEPTSGEAQDAAATPTDSPTPCPSGSALDPAAVESVQSVETPTPTGVPDAAS
jgi:hypothetical protein